MKLSNRRREKNISLPLIKLRKNEMFRLLFSIDKILHNFDDIFIMNLLKLLHLRKIKPITSSKNMFCSVDCRKMEYYDLCQF